MSPKIRNKIQDKIFNGRSNTIAAISANTNAQVLCITSKIVFIFKWFYCLYTEPKFKKIVTEYVIRFNIFFEFFV